MMRDVGVDYNDGKWHMWNGEIMKPASVHPKSKIECVWHNELTGKHGVDILDVGDSTKSDTWFAAWDNILKFRVTKEYKEPREYWIAVDGGRVIDMVEEKPQDMYGYIHVREVTE